MLKNLGPGNLVFSLLMLCCQKSHAEEKNLIKTQFFISWDLPSAGHAIGIVQRNHYKNDFFFFWLDPNVSRIFVVFPLI